MGKGSPISAAARHPLLAWPNVVKMSPLFGSVWKRESPWAPEENVKPLGHLDGYLAPERGQKVSIPTKGQAGSCWNKCTSADMQGPLSHHLGHQYHQPPLPGPTVSRRHSQLHSIGERAWNAGCPAARSKPKDPSSRSRLFRAPQHVALWCCAIHDLSLTWLCSALLATA